MADPKEQEVKQARRAAALRENLKRRKAQTRARDDGQPDARQVASTDNSAVQPEDEHGA